MSPAAPAAPPTRREGWIVRSIRAEELPSVCAYCHPHHHQLQAVAIIAYQIWEVLPAGKERLKSERTAPVCVDHGVHVQQTKILVPEAVA